MHKATAHVRIQTIYGKYYVCSDCYVVNHMQDENTKVISFYDENDDHSIPSYDLLKSCQCEHSSHIDE